MVVANSAEDVLYITECSNMCASLFAILAALISCCSDIVLAIPHIYVSLISSDAFQKSFDRFYRYGRTT